MVPAEHYALVENGNFVPRNQLDVAPNTHEVAHMVANEAAHMVANEASHTNASLNTPSTAHDASTETAGPIINFIPMHDVASAATNETTQREFQTYEPISPAPNEMLKTLNLG